MKGLGTMGQKPKLDPNGNTVHECIYMPESLRDELREKVGRGTKFQKWIRDVIKRALKRIKN